jgi:DNA polymerase I
MSRFSQIWACDFEFRADPGERPWAVCMVAREVGSGTEITLWRDELLALKRAPFDTGKDSLFVAYYASAEIGCFLELDWPLPTNILDLFTEFRCATNGLGAQSSLLAALAHYRIPAAINAGEKDKMRKLVLQQTEWSEQQKREISDYCASDVVSLAALYRRMGPMIAIEQALLRGRYMAAVARMERNGVPIDVPTLAAIKANWKRIKLGLIAGIDGDFSVYEGTVFKTNRFLAYCARERIRWPMLPSGRPCLDSESFRDMAKVYPQIHPLHELRVTLGEMRLSALEVGQEGRNRCLLSTFRSRTGRNQPSNTKFCFGPARWIRHLIKPPEGYGLAYLDWSAQELALAAALSCDQAMISAYVSGDPYLSFAIAAGLAPADATKESHETIRERCKTVCLGVLYGMEAETLARRMGVSPAEAHELLRLHRETYRRFWAWSDTVVERAMLSNETRTLFGWRLQCKGGVNARSLMNFPCQAHGAEMMRLAAIAGTEAGIEICCPVHDAVLIAAPLDRLEADADHMAHLMGMAAKAVTGGLAIRVDTKFVRFPDRFTDKRGARMWERVIELLSNLQDGDQLCLECSKT